MIPEVTQDNVRIFIPLKVANVCSAICEHEQLSEIEAIRKFYSTKTARELSHEASKLWYYGWPCIYDMYKEETAQVSK